MTSEERILGIRDKRTVHLVERLIGQRDLDPGQMERETREKRRGRGGPKDGEGGKETRREASAVASTRSFVILRVLSSVLRHCIKFRFCSPLRG